MLCSHQVRYTHFSIISQRSWLKISRTGRLFGSQCIVSFHCVISSHKTRTKRFWKVDWHGNIFLPHDRVHTFHTPRWIAFTPEMKRFPPVSSALPCPHDRKLHLFARRINFEQSTRARLSYVFQNFLLFSPQPSYLKRNASRCGSRHKKKASRWM